MYILCVGILLIFAGLCFCKIRSLDILISILIYIYLVALTYFSTNIADNLEYTYLFDYVNINPEVVSSVTSSNWVRICQLGIQNKLSYQQLKTILFAICLLIIFLLIKKWVGNSISFVLSLYLTFPALIDIIQIRFFVALVCCIIGLYFLEQDKKWTLLFYIICVLLGATVHNTVIFLLIFILIPVIKKYRSKLLISILSIDIFFLIFGKRFLSIIENIVSDKQAKYFDYGLPLLSCVAMIITMILLALICHMISQQIVHSDGIKDKYKNIAEFIDNANTCMLLLIGILPLSFNMYRLERISWILFYILLGIMLKYNININIFNKVKVNAKLIATVTYIIVFAIMVLHFEPAAFWSYPFFN